MWLKRMLNHCATKCVPGIESFFQDEPEVKSPSVIYLILVPGLAMLNIEHVKLSSLCSIAFLGPWRMSPASCWFTCRVLSNQRFPLCWRLPPPWSIWVAALLRCVSSVTWGFAPSRHSVKMLLWIMETESLLTLSGREIQSYVQTPVKPSFTT